MDESLSNLDTKLREAMRFEIRELQRNLGFTCLYVTHDQLEAMVLSDKALIMNAGSIEQYGSPREIYRYPKNALRRGLYRARELPSGEDRRS